MFVVIILCWVVLCEVEKTMFHEEINNLNALQLSIILYTALFKEILFNAVTNNFFILIIGGYLQFDWTLSNPTKFKANINLLILSCNNMYIISVCRCAKQRNRNSVCKHKSFTFLGLGSKYRYKIIYWYTMRKERWLIKILKTTLILKIRMSPN